MTSGWAAFWICVEIALCGAVAYCLTQMRREIRRLRALRIDDRRR